MRQVSPNGNIMSKPCRPIVVFSCFFFVESLGAQQPAAHLSLLQAGLHRDQLSRAASRHRRRRARNGLRPESAPAAAQTPSSSSSSGGDGQVWPLAGQAGRPSGGVVRLAQHRHVSLKARKPFPIDTHMKCVEKKTRTTHENNTSENIYL